MVFISRLRIAYESKMQDIYKSFGHTIHYNPILPTLQSITVRHTSLFIKTIIFRYWLVFCVSPGLDSVIDDALVWQNGCGAV